MSKSDSEICNALNHRGKILENTLRKQGVNLSKLAKKLPWSLKTIYRHFQEEKLPFEKIAEYGRAIHYSFTEEFPELEKFNFKVLEEIPIYKNSDDVEYYRLKYEQLLERYNSMLEKYTELMSKQLEITEQK